MRALRFALAALVLGCGTARATTFATDVTDLWWNTSESGWGVNVIHQDATLFLTFFVYGSNRAPIWYSASEVSYVTSPPSQTTYTGDLYQTSGPYLGGTYDQSTVTYRKVGTVTFIVDTPTVASLTYTVDGVTVQKTLTRYTFRVNNTSGNYRGVISGALSNCTPSTMNGSLNTFLTAMTVTHNNSTLSMQTTDSLGVTCNYSAVYSQEGKVGVLSGGFSCTDGRLGPWQAELEANTHGFLGRFNYSWPACTFTGSIAAART